MRDKKIFFSAHPGITKAVVLILCPILVIVICSAAIVITAKNLVPDDVIPETDHISYMDPFPEKTEDAFSLVSAKVKSIVSNNRVQLRSSYAQEIEHIDGEITEAQKSLLGFIGNRILSSVQPLYVEKEIDFGQALAGQVPDISALSFPESFEAKEESAGQYEISLVFSPENAIFLSSLDAAKVLQEVRDQYVDTVFTLNASEAKAVGAEVTANIDGRYGILTGLSVKTSYEVSIDCTFLGEFADLGNQKFSFVYSLTENYSFTHAGVFIADSVLYLDKNGYETLDAGIYVSENAAPEEYDLIFTSSNPDVLTIDETGYMQAVSESPDPVTVTVVLNYLDTTFYDFVEVYVITLAEGVDLSESEITLSLGEESTLSAEVKPKNATIKNVLWMSTDESVAVVDENGRVTAVGAGEAQIIVITQIGRFSKACTVKVQ